MALDLLRLTVYASIFVQLTIGAVDYVGLTYKVPEQHQILIRCAGAGNHCANG